MVSNFMNGKYSLIIYAGISMAELNYFSSVMSSDFKIFIEPFKFTNDYDSLYLLLSRQAPLDQDSIIIDLATTAHLGNKHIYFPIK